LTRGWLETMIDCMRSDPGIGLVGPRTNRALGKQVLAVSFGPDEKEAQRFAFQLAARNAGKRFETNVITAFRMVVKAGTVKDVGLFDERFGLGYFEDVDYCIRVRKAGYKIVVASDVFVYHIGGQTSLANKLDHAEMKRRNLRILIEKWGEKTLAEFNKK